MNAAHPSRPAVKICCIASLAETHLAPSRPAAGFCRQESVTMHLTNLLLVTTLDVWRF